MLFIGMPGGIHSLLTPELTHGITLTGQNRLLFSSWWAGYGSILCHFCTKYVAQKKCYLAGLFLLLMSSL